MKRMEPEKWPGQPFPLGATFDGSGTNFSIFSEVAEGVELCLFDFAAEARRVELSEVDALRWHAYLPGVAPASATASECTDPGTPLGPPLQPGEAAARPLRQGHRRGGDLGPGGLRPPARRRRPGPDDDDSAPFVPRSVVTNLSTGTGTRRYVYRWHETVVYEAHVKGFTKRHPEIPRDLRGTYAGMAHRRSSST